MIDESGAVPGQGPQSAADWGLPDPGDAGPVDLDKLRALVGSVTQAGGDQTTTMASPPSQPAASGLFGQGARQSVPMLPAPDSGTPDDLPLKDNLPAFARAATSLGSSQASAIAGFPVSPTTPDASPFDRARAVLAKQGNIPGAGMPRLPGYDYDGALAGLMPQQVKHSKTHNTIMDILSVLATAGMALGGNEAGANSFAASLRDRKLLDEKRRYDAAKLLAEWKHQDWARQNEADLHAGAPFTLGRQRMVADPLTGQTRTLATAPTDFQTYAQSMGYEPGTDDYNNAQQDYVLRGDGPTALDNREQMDDYRTGNHLKLEGVRQGNRESMESLRQGNRVGLEGIRQRNRMGVHQAPTYRDMHGGGGRASIKTVSSPAEAAKLPPGTQYKTPDGHVYVR